MTGPAVLSDDSLVTLARLEGKKVTAKRFNYDGSRNLQGEDNYADMDYPSDDIEGVLVIEDVPPFIYDNRIVMKAYTKHLVDGQSAAVETIAEKVMRRPAAAVARRIRRPIPAGLSVLEAACRSSPSGIRIAHSSPRSR
jgi:hypothetical protein